MLKRSWWCCTPPRIPWRVAVVLYTALLAVASLLPSSDDTPLGGWDGEISPTVQSVMHLPAYTVFIILVLLAFAQPVRTTGTKKIILLAVGCIAFGAFMEWLQAIAIPGRTGSLDDALINTAGVLLGMILFFTTTRCIRAIVPTDNCQLPP